MTNLFVKNYMEQGLKTLLEMQELKDIILFVLLIRMRNRTHNLLDMVSEVEVIFHHKIQQQKH